MRISVISAKEGNGIISQLGDTVERVGRDLQRKLAPNDRLIGALNLCIKNGIEPVGIVTGIIAALQFKDSMASEVVTMLEQNEVENILLNFCALTKGSMAYDKIVEGFK
ncbi:MAG: hypothetical protein H7X94_14965, partial [Vallitaleaceae bacterium]|nr:hypothetical protein [Vallitaleaceae bacterium]